MGTERLQTALRLRDHQRRGDRAKEPDCMVLQDKRPGLRRCQVRLALAVDVIDDDLLALAVDHDPALGVDLSDGQVVADLLLLTEGRE